MSGSHSRKGSSRDGLQQQKNDELTRLTAALTRRTTRGPLDIDDPLSDSRSLSVSPIPPSSSPLIASTEFTNSNPVTIDNQPGTSNVTSKDLSFLLDAAIFHPLTNIDIPPQHRHPFPPNPAPGVSLQDVFSQLTALLGRYQFLAAAHLAAGVLTSGVVQPTDSTSIFRLLSIRFSALELSGNLLLAAQESKALEDLSSTFYYEEVSKDNSTAGISGTEQPISKHIMPFDLRLQIMRLQGIGFGDLRRVVGALYDLGMECRDNLARATTSERPIWAERLDETGVRVVNALIDMNDLDCAKRSLHSIMSSHAYHNGTWTSRMIMLLIRMGETAEARTLAKQSDLDLPNQSVLQAFLEISDGNYQEATSILSQSVEEGADIALVAIAKQNLAVAYLYTGEIQRSREILQELVSEGFSFQALTINLATLYDLMSDKSRDMKTDLVSKVASIDPKFPRRGFVNADFKL